MSVLCDMFPITSNVEYDEEEWQEEEEEEPIYEPTDIFPEITNGTNSTRSIQLPQPNADMMQPPMLDVSINNFKKYKDFIGFLFFFFVL